MNLSDWLKSTGTRACDLAREVETTEATISRLRHGRAQPSFDLARRIAAATGGQVTANDFMGASVGPSESGGTSAGLADRRIVLIIAGGIAAYKSLDLIRRLRERGASVRVILTPAGAEFVTPLSVGALAGEAPFQDLFDARSEFDVGHIRLAREADLIVVAPATADLMAKMAAGLADDLATAVLLAADAPVLLAPAMNPHMWAHRATERNVAQLRRDGVDMVGPNEGEMAEAGEWGLGRMAEVAEIVAAIESRFAGTETRPLADRRVLVTSGPTHEPIDPVRYLANRSSGRQGHAVAAAAARFGAEVTLISGPTALPDPPGVTTHRVETAKQMLAAALDALPADIAVCAAAVGDWTSAAVAEQKLKKTGGRDTMELAFVQNPDILRRLSEPGPERPSLVIGFAAETENVLANATAKRAAKGCDWIVANDVSAETGIMGGARNRVHLVRGDGVEDWPEMAKEDVAEALMRRAAEHVGTTVAAE